MLDVLCVGHASYDITMAVTHHPDTDEKVLANAAVCVARLGGKAGFCGYLSHDLFGETHLHELLNKGIDTSLVVRGEQPSPVSQILAKSDGSRSVVNFKSSTPHLQVSDLASPQAAKVMLFDGHEPLISTHLCRWAKMHHIPTILDAGSLHLGTRALAESIDYLVTSEKFAQQWTGECNLQAALQSMAKRSPCSVITMGQDGLIWNRNGVSGTMNAFAIDAVDSTGAGDAFHAAFAYGLSQGMSWEALLRYASAAGALACTTLGARAALPDRKRVESLLKQG